jgi:hypothetical protein
MEYDAIVIVVFAVDGKVFDGFRGVFWVQAYLYVAVRCVDCGRRTGLRFCYRELFLVFCYCAGFFVVNVAVGFVDAVCLEKKEG